MCKEYSCIVLPDGSILDGRPIPDRNIRHWIHSHSDILDRHGIKDDNASGQLFARVEFDINNLWSKREIPLSLAINWLKIDQTITPRWFKDRHRKAALRSFIHYIKNRANPLQNYYRIIHNNTCYGISNTHRTFSTGTPIYKSLWVGSHRFKAHYPYKNPLYRKARTQSLKILKYLDSPHIKAFSKAFPLP